ncbi:MAG: glycosyltransferase family 39 protein [Pseudomonadota bacterium]
MSSAAPTPAPTPRAARALAPLHPWGDALAMALLALATALVGVLLQRHVHPGIPFGIDMDLWSFSAIDLRAGHPSLVPPGYPALTALFSQLTGAGPLAAATAVSAGAMAAVPPLTWLLARRLGAGMPAAGVAALAPLLTPGLILEGHQVTPDPLTAVCLLLLALAAARLIAHPGWRAHAALLAAVAVTCVVREHGQVAAVLAIAVLLATPGLPRRRLLGAALVIAAVALAPVLVGRHPAMPWATPWWGRTALVFSDAVSDHPSWQAKPGQAGIADTRLSLLLHALGGAPFGWAWLGLGVLGALLRPRQARAALTVGALPALPALLVYSQPRHVLVVVPVAAAVAMAATRRFTGGARGLLLAGALGMSVSGACYAWGPLTHLLEGQVAETRKLRGLGAAICALPEEGLCWAGDLRAFTFCPLPAFDTDNSPAPGLWKALFAGRAPPSADFERLDLPDDAGFVLYRLRAEGGERPCAASRPGPSAPLLVTSPTSFVLDPPCDVPPPKAALLGLVNLKRRK